ncbi:MAG: DUF1996 domain-containing protein, partial [Acidimicrobiales bacterium]|nr:DUF1996 domain-containing protein [Acidimicrobiales bacterium]
LSACSPITIGTSGRTSMNTNTPNNAGSAHGTRVYCPVSHFSYDDPVVYPGQRDASHLHMFWGNTETNATTTAQSLANSGRATCEGGRNNRSAYWIPALFNARDEVVLPEKVISYYKSFAVSSNFDRNTIMPIPNGLQMLAHPNIANSVPRYFDVSVTGKGLLKLSLHFPTCIAVNGSGQPILSSPDNSPNRISHLAYPTSGTGNSNECPSSHPYRIPGLSYNVQYDIDPNSDWYLASDTNRNNPGHSLHGDYFASWDAETMNRVVECQRLEKRACQFLAPSGASRTQLPERFRDHDGNQLYNDSITLRDSVDRTPFGTQLKPSKHG